MTINDKMIILEQKIDHINSKNVTSVKTPFYQMLDSVLSEVIERDNALSAE